MSHTGTPKRVAPAKDKGEGPRKCDHNGKDNMNQRVEEARVPSTGPSTVSMSLPIYL